VIKKKQLWEEATLKDVKRVFLSDLSAHTMRVGSMEEAKRKRQLKKRKQQKNVKGLLQL
jgi:hypothetical protein